VAVVDIGIGPEAPVEPTIGLIEPSVVDAIPMRGRESNKFAAGSVVVCGGSVGLTGAPCLASEAAARAGAGYVTALVPASLNLIFEGRLLEVMTVPLPDTAGALTPDGVERALERLSRAQSLVLGPGLGRADESVAMCREVARRAEVPLLLDADGLNAHAQRLESLAKRPAPTVLTPHAGELGRLLDVSSAEIERHRLAFATRAASVARAVVVLKGDDTIVADPSGVTAVNRGGAPALATAGTGDVLSGVIGAFLAKGMEPRLAAGAGAVAHGLASRLVSPQAGLVAGDLLPAIQRALEGEGADLAPLD